MTGLAFGMATSLNYGATHVAFPWLGLGGLAVTNKRQGIARLVIGMVFAGFARHFVFRRKRLSGRGLFGRIRAGLARCKAVVQI